MLDSNSQYVWGLEKVRPLGSSTLIWPNFSASMSELSVEKVSALEKLNVRNHVFVFICYNVVLNHFNADVDWLIGGSRGEQQQQRWSQGSCQTFNCHPTIASAT